MISIICDYIRMMGYAIVILLSLEGIAKKRFTNLLFLGDIFIAFGLFMVIVQANYFGLGRDITSDFVLTPIVTIWAIIHFISFIKQ